MEFEFEPVDPKRYHLWVDYQEEGGGFNFYLFCEWCDMLERDARREQGLE